MDTLKFVTFIRLDEYGSPGKLSEFMRIYNNLNIVVKSSGGDASSLHGSFMVSIRLWKILPEHSALIQAIRNSFGVSSISMLCFFKNNIKWIMC